MSIGTQEAQTPFFQLFGVGRVADLKNLSVESPTIFPTDLFCTLRGLRKLLPSTPCRPPHHFVAAPPLPFSPRTAQNRTTHSPATQAARTPHPTASPRQKIPPAPTLVPNLPPPPQVTPFMGCASPTFHPNHAETAPHAAPLRPVPHPRRRE